MTEPAAQTNTDAGAVDNTSAESPVNDTTPENQQGLNDATDTGLQQGGEQRGQATDTADGEGADDTQSQGAPGEYTDFAFPEGFQVEETKLTEFKSFAKELNLSQENAQKLIDFDMQRQKAAQESMMQGYQNQLAQWKDATMSDAEMREGGLDANLTASQKAVEVFATDELRALLNPYHPEKNPNGMGLGNHPEVVRLFKRIGKAISEDSVVLPSGNDTGNEPRNREDVLYGKQSEE